MGSVSNALEPRLVGERGAHCSVEFAGVGRIEKAMLAVTERLVAQDRRVVGERNRADRCGFEMTGALPAIAAWRPGEPGGSQALQIFLVR